MSTAINTQADTEKTGAQLLVDCLAANKVERLSCVAGESYMAVLDAVLEHKDINVITCRHEGGAAFMAEAYGKLTSQPGICFVTRGPGACNASIGVHTAMQDSTPMILFMGQVARKDKGKEAFQEIDVRNVFGGLAKWATEIDDPARIPEVIQQAFQTALSGRMGPVVIGLPEDMLTALTEAPMTVQPAQKIVPQIAQTDIKNLKEMLKSASRPIIIAGGNGWPDSACAQLADFAGTNKISVATAFRRQDIFDHNHPCYVGELGTGPNPELINKIQESDLVLVLGARLSETVTMGYSLFEGAKNPQKLVHIYPDDSELNRLYTADLAILSGTESAVTSMAGKIRLDGRKWADWTKSLRQAYEQWTTIDTTRQPDWNGADMTAIFAHLRDHLPADCVITTDAGNFSGWAQRYLRYGRPNRLLAPTSGAMGYAVPAVLSAALEHPERLCLGICGDGGFMMTGQELATALHHKAKPVILVCNNNMYGTIRMHQERAYPGRVSATGLTNPDFTMLAESYDAFGARVESASDFPAIWDKSLSSGKAALIEIKMDPRQITTKAKV